MLQNSDVEHCQIVKLVYMFVEQTEKVIQSYIYTPKQVVHVYTRIKWKELHREHFNGDLK